MIPISDFQKYVENEFDFLVENYGFKMKKVLSRFITDLERDSEFFYFIVEYASQNVIIEVTYSGNNGRNEAQIFINQRHSSHLVFDFRSYFEEFYPTIGKPLTCRIISSDDHDLTDKLKQLSNLLKEYAKPIISFDKRIFSRFLKNDRNPDAF